MSPHKTRCVGGLSTNSGRRLYFKGVEFATFKANPFLFLLTLDSFIIELLLLTLICYCDGVYTHIGSQLYACFLLPPNQ